MPVGSIVGAFGLRGEVKIAAGDPAEVRAGMRLEARLGDGARRDIELLEARPHKNLVVAKIAGISDVDATRALIGAALFADSRMLPDLPAGTYRDADLIGLRVIDESLGDLGEVRSIAHYPSADMLVVDDALIPLQRAYGVTVDRVAGTITTRLPDGFEELRGSAKATRASQHSRPPAAPHAEDALPPR